MFAYIYIDEYFLGGQLGEPHRQLLCTLLFLEVHIRRAAYNPFDMQWNLLRKPQTLFSAAHESMYVCVHVTRQALIFLSQ